MKTKVILILVSSLISFSLIAADNTNKTVIIKKDNVVETTAKKKSFVETLSLKPYYAGFASLEENADDFNFNHAAIGLELSVPVYSQVDLIFDAVGIDNISDDPVVDRVGLGFSINFPVKRSKLEFYAQTVAGFWFGEEELDIVLRAGAKYNFNKHFGVFSDVGTGISMQDGNAYQQLRGGLSLSF